MFETTGSPEPRPADRLDVPGLDDPTSTLDRPPRRWARRSAQYSLQELMVGVRYEIEDREGDAIGSGWRLTIRGAKRAARRRIRRKTGTVGRSSSDG